MVRTRLAAIVMVVLAVHGACIPMQATALELGAVLRQVAAAHPPITPGAKMGVAQAPAASRTHFERCGEAWSIYADIYCAQMLARLHEERGATLERMIQSVLGAYQTGPAATSNRAWCGPATAMATGCKYSRAWRKATRLWRAPRF